MKFSSVSSILVLDDFFQLQKEMPLQFQLLKKRKELPLNHIKDQRAAQCFLSKS